MIMFILQGLVSNFQFQIGLCHQKKHFFSIYLLHFNWFIKYQKYKYDYIVEEEPLAGGGFRRTPFSAARNMEDSDNL